MSDISRREFMLAASQATALAGAAVSLEASAAGVADVKMAFDPAIHVHPELRASVPELQKVMQQMGSPTLEGLPAARKAQPEPPLLPQPAWTERTIVGPRNSRLRIYIVNAGTGQQLRPAILHTHGGGFISGSARFSLPMVQAIAAAIDCVVVSVDYRLAPETPFPGALEDNYAALKWLYENAVELGVDRSRIAVLGESAGGGHAAMLALAARDRGEVPLVFLALIYPMLDDRTGSTRPVPPHIGTLLWTAELNRFGWTSLLGVRAGSDRVPVGAVPARVENLRGLPPTFIGVGSIDLFVREDIEYAQRLIDAAVPVELQVVPGAYHAFEAIVPTANVSKQFTAAINAALARALATQSSSSSNPQYRY